MTYTQQRSADGRRVQVRCLACHDVHTGSDVSARDWKRTHACEDAA